jgi:microsomal dipeptidase-like Zn-dependent dipeptidase
MEIVYDPEQAYQVMSEGRLAVVLGSEVDGLGDLGFGSAEEEVDYLWRLGIRQVTPVHAVDNRIGAATVFQDLYNTTNDLVNRPVRHARRGRIADDVRDQGLAIRPRGAGRPNFGHFMRVDPGYFCGGRLDRAPPIEQGECVDWRYGHSQMMFGLDFNAFILGFHPAVHSQGEDHNSVYPDGSPGHRNANGVTAFGRDYIRALMRRGMLIDLEHMSDRTFDAITDPSAGSRGPVWDAIPAGRPGCDFKSSTPRLGAPDPCFADAYPLMSSHTSFRGQSLLSRGNPGATTLVKDFKAREFERTPAQIDYIRRSGGVIAPVVGHDPVRRTPDGGTGGRPTFRIAPGFDGPLRTGEFRGRNNCAGSSKSWIEAYLYGVQKMRGSGVALSTDMAVVGSTRPRFNPPGASTVLPENCDSSAAHLDLDEINFFHLLFDTRGPEAYLTDAIARGRAREEEGYPDQFRRGAEDQAPRLTTVEDQVAGRFLWRHTTPAGTSFDFNTQGLKSFGLLPDLLQDARNLGVAREDLRPLLRSGQAYLDMWNKAYKVTGCDVGPRTTQEQYERCAGTGVSGAGAGACRNTCPNDPGRGHALRPNGAPLFRR